MKRKDQVKNWRIKDLSGQTFGRLTAISQAEERSHGYVVWECECSCGGKKRVLSSNLVNGSTKSCGCYQKDRVQALNVQKLSGQTFGRLTAISQTEERGSDGSVIWECECSCGGKKKVLGNSLRRGHVKSCGCLARENSIQASKKAIKEVKKLCVEGTRLSALSSKKYKVNTSGIRGVTWIKKAQKWRASITFQEKYIYLGRFENIEDAAAARKEAEEKYFRPMLEKYQDRLTPKPNC